MGVSSVLVKTTILIVFGVVFVVVVIRKCNAIPWSITPVP